MIATLQGILREKKPTEVVLDVGGVGFAVNIPLSTFDRLDEPGASVRLLTHLIVREDVLQLYGFLSPEERDAFRLLMSVSGIGPKMAQGILSGIGVIELQSAIAGGNVHTLTAIPGVGRKLADRLIVELRDKIGKLSVGGSPAERGPGGSSTIREEAVLALVSLGYNRATAERSVSGAIRDDPSCSETLQLLIKAAMRSTH